MKKKSKKSRKPEPPQSPKISPPQDPVTEPSENFQTRMLSKDQLENFLKDVWDDSIRKKWWERAERFLIMVISFCAPILYQSIKDIFSESKIKKEAFCKVGFWLPAAGVLGSFIIIIILRSLKNNIFADKDKKQFVAYWMKKYPMTTSVSVPLSSFKPINPSAAEPEQK